MGPTQPAIRLAPRARPGREADRLVPRLSMRGAVLSPLPW